MNDDVVSAVIDGTSRGDFAGIIIALLLLVAVVIGKIFDDRLFGRTTRKKDSDDDVDLQKVPKKLFFIESKIDGVSEKIIKLHDWHKPKKVDEGNQRIEKFDWKSNAAMEIEIKEIRQDQEIIKKLLYKLIKVNSED